MAEQNIRTVTASTDLTAWDETILVDDTSAAVTIGLPPAGSVPRKVFRIKKIGASNATTIDAAGSETIDGMPTQVVTTQYNSFTLQTDGVAWYIL